MEIFIHYRALSELSVQGNDSSVILNQKLQRKKIYQFRQQRFAQFLFEDSQHQVVINDDEFGKPYLKDFPDVFFNQSHSQSYYALAYSQQCKHVGIDIEDFSRTVRMDALAQRFFHVNEINQWLDLNKDRKFWFKVWTAKEAVLKAHGLGIRLQLSSLDTCIQPDNLQGVVKHEQIGQFRYEHIDMGHSMLCVAYEDLGTIANIVLK